MQCTRGWFTIKHEAPRHRQQLALAVLGFPDHRGSPTGEDRGLRIDPALLSEKRRRGGGGGPEGGQFMDQKKDPNHFKGVSKVIADRPCEILVDPRRIDHLA